MDDTTHDVSKRSLYFRATLLSHSSCRNAQKSRHADTSRSANSLVRYVIHTPSAFNASSRVRRVITVSDTAMLAVRLSFAVEYHFALPIN